MCYTCIRLKSSASLKEDAIEAYENHRRLKYHRVWQWADRAITNHELFPDTPDVDTVLEVRPLTHLVIHLKFVERNMQFISAEP